MPDRDDRKTLTPPAGVQAQIAPPLKKPRAATPIDGIEFDAEPTGVGQRPSRPETPMEKVLRRTGEAKNNSLVTLEELAELRTDHGAAIAAVNTKVDKLSGKVDASIGQNDRILGHLLAIREKRELNDIELDKREREQNLDHAKATQEIKRRHFDSLAAKVVAAIAIVVTGLAGLLAAGKLSCSAQAPAAITPAQGSGG